LRHRVIETAAQKTVREAVTEAAAERTVGEAGLRLLFITYILCQRA